MTTLTNSFRTLPAPPVPLRANTFSQDEQWIHVVDNPVRIGQILHGANGYWVVQNRDETSAMLQRCDRLGNTTGLYVFPGIKHLSSPQWKIYRQAPRNPLWRDVLLGLGLAALVGIVLYVGFGMDYVEQIRK